MRSTLICMAVCFLFAGCRIPPTAERCVAPRRACEGQRSNKCSKVQVLAKDKGAMNAARFRFVTPNHFISVTQIIVHSYIRNMLWVWLDMPRFWACGLVHKIQCGSSNLSSVAHKVKANHGRWLYERRQCWVNVPFNPSSTFSACGYILRISSNCGCGSKRQRRLPSLKRIQMPMRARRDPARWCRREQGTRNQGERAAQPVQCGTGKLLWGRCIIYTQNMS
jgi:hypothetical protein